MPPPPKAVAVARALVYAVCLGSDSGIYTGERGMVGRKTSKVCISWNSVSQGNSQRSCGDWRIYLQSPIPQALRIAPRYVNSFKIPTMPHKSFIREEWQTCLWCEKLSVHSELSTTIGKLRWVKALGATALEASDKLDVLQFYKLAKTRTTT